jgi:conjugative transposon TraM protein
MKTFLKKNKTLLFLPLVLLPFVVLIFYILGGGENTKREQTAGVNHQSGINYHLPEAEKSITISDKMEAWERQLNRSATTDYNILEESDSLSGETPEGTPLSDDMYAGTSQDKIPGPPENLLAHIRNRETSIRKELEGEPGESESMANAKTRGTTLSGGKKSGTNKTGEINESKKQREPLFTGITELDKVFDENIVLTRQNDSLKQSLQKFQMEELKREKRQNGSFTLEKGTRSGFQQGESENNPVKAEIYETATVLDGNRVKLRLLENVRINGLEITQNSFIYGICKISNERLQITVSHIPSGETFLPVTLAIHDLDGLPGLYVPDNAARKVTKEAGSSANTSSVFGVTGDPLTYAGIRAADRTTQALLKRVRLKRVTVKKNTLVYLINQNQQP